LKKVNTLANHEGLLYAKRISPEGCQIDLDLADPNTHKSGSGILWLHMCAIDPDTRGFLNNETGLDELVVNALLALHDVDNVSEKIRNIRIRTAVFRRYINPQRMVLEGLIKAKFSWLSEENIEHLVESHDRVTRYVETLNDIRDRAQIINDEIDKLNSAKLNSMTYMFSVAATIFLPLTFLTGLMGINIGGMPGVDRTEAFWIFTVLCIIIVAIQIMIFKKLKWF
jgi:Mg2+ and Co2+ transporter CorA